MERFRGEFVLKAHRLLYHSPLGSRVIKKKKSWRTFTDTVAQDCTYMGLHVHVTPTTTNYLTYMIGLDAGFRA